MPRSMSQMVFSFCYTITSTFTTLYLDIWVIGINKSSINYICI